MRSLLGTALVLIVILAAPSLVMADGTRVHRFSNEPFDFWQCYSTSGWIPGPAATFGEDVCVHYVAMNSETVRFHGSDVAWSLIQIGTATVYAVDNWAELYSGPFQVEEIARDNGGDAQCVWTDGQHAWLGICQQLYSNLDFAVYNWKITGASVYYFKLTVKGPGMWCYDAKGIQYGPGC